MGYIDKLKLIYLQQTVVTGLITQNDFFINDVENWINSIIKKSFRNLFNTHICRYKDYKNKKIRVAGSVGYYFNKQLIEVAAEFNLKIDQIEKEQEK